MSELRAQSYLRKHGVAGLESLATEYAIAAKRHREYPNLVLLKRHGQGYLLRKEARR